MNRLVKAAVAVTAFGLAAALAVPAHGEVQHNTARYAPSDGLGDGALAGSPLGLLGGFGGLVGGGGSPISGLLGGGPLGGLLGGKSKSGGGQQSEAEQDAAMEFQVRRSSGDPNAAEDATRTGGRLPEVSPILQPLSALGVTQVPGAARQALPMSATGGLSPMVGQVAPAEMAPVMEALPGATRAARFDDLTPLVKDASNVVYAKGTGATGSYSDLVTALGWTAEGLTGSVRDSWIR